MSAGTLSIEEKQGGKNRESKKKREFYICVRE